MLWAVCLFYTRHLTKESEPPSEEPHPHRPGLRPQGHSPWNQEVLKALQNPPHT